MAFDFMKFTKPLWERGGALALPAATTLSAYLKNIIEHPQELRYRRIPADGKVFTERVARCAGATDVLLASGFALETLAGARVWILRERDEPRLRAILHELDVAVATARKLQATRAAPPTAAPSASAPSLELQARARSQLMQARERRAARSPAAVGGAALGWLSRLLMFAFATTLAAEAVRRRHELLIEVAYAAGAPPPPFLPPLAAGAAEISVSPLSVGIALVVGWLILAGGRRRWQPAAGTVGHGGGHASILAFLVPRRVVSAATRGAVALLLLSQAFALAEQEWACGSGAMAVHPAERWPRARAASILGLPACGASTEAAAAAFRRRSLRAHPDKQRGAHTLWAQLERAARLELGPCEMAIALRDGPAARFIALQGAYDTLRSRNSNM